MKRLFKILSNWFKSVAQAFAHEFTLVFRDGGVLLFFFFLPLAYPIVYTLIYNPELCRDISVVVVDDCRTAQSRELVRMADATEAMHIIGYAANMDEAKRAMHEKEAFGIFLIPRDYSERIGRGEQGVTAFFSDMTLLLRYRSFMAALTDLQLASGAQIRTETLDAMGASSIGGTSLPVNQEAYFLGDPTQGFASFIMPGIVILILQQSLVLGITMLAGGAAERRRRFGGVDPWAINVPQGAGMIGRMLCYLVIYIPLTIYILHYVMVMFSLPHIGPPLDYLLFVVPLLVGSVFLGMTLQVFVTERESSMLIVVFTSVIFLFISGLTWPRYAMSWLWKAVGNLIPATWGIEGFIQINSNGGTLTDNPHPYIMLWIVALCYFFVAYLALRYAQKYERRKYAPNPDQPYDA